MISTSDFVFYHLLICLNICCRFFSFLSGRVLEDADDTYAALALMYGYAARYAPSTVIEARINALVV